MVRRNCQSTIYLIYAFNWKIRLLEKNLVENKYVNAFFSVVSYIDVTVEQNIHWRKETVLVSQNSLFVEDKMVTENCICKKIKLIQMMDSEKK